MTASRLRRELGLPEAVLLGLGSIIGTGVFVSLAVATEAGGSLVVVAVVVAAVLATANGLSSAQLAASHPVSGGTYEYGYRYLSPALGFTAGWTFLLAKSASAATAALGCSGYALATLGVESTALVVPIATLAVVACTALVLAGLRRSSVVNAVVVTVTLVTLAAFVVAAMPAAVQRVRVGPELDGTGGAGLPGVLEAVALAFVAYTGYGRIATLGEEVRDPRRTIPRAIIVTLAVTMVLYLAVAWTAVAAVGPQRFAATVGGVAAPLVLVALEIDRPVIAACLSIGAVTAMVGVLLNLVLGLSRVAMAMGRRGDMPATLGRVDRQGRAPTAAVVTTGVAVAMLTLVGDVRVTWSFSAFTVLVYYALTNAAALRLASEDRLYPRPIAWAGLVACLGLAFWVPAPVWASGLVLIAAGLGWHALRRSASTRA